jgi:hypothetical protein
MREHLTPHTRNKKAAGFQQLFVDFANNGGAIKLPGRHRAFSSILTAGFSLFTLSA